MKIKDVHTELNSIIEDYYDRNIEEELAKEKIRNLEKKALDSGLKIKLNTNLVEELNRTSYDEDVDESSYDDE